MMQSEAVVAEEAFGLSVEECWAAMEAGHTFDKWAEVAMRWQKGTPERYTVALDPAHHHVFLYSLDRKKEDGQVIEIEAMTSLRVLPFTDESEDVAVKTDQLPRFLMVAFWEKLPDFVNVLLLNMVAETPEIALTWRKGLRALIKSNTWNCPRFVSQLERLQRQYAFLRFYADENNLITIKAISEVLGKDAKDQIKEELLNKEGSLFQHKNEISLDVFTFDAFLDLERTVVPRPEMKQIFERLSDGAPTMNTTQLRRFLVEEQRDVRLNEILDPEPSINDCAALIREFEPDPELKGKTQLGLQGFYLYLQSQHNDPMHPAVHSVNQDMGRPLSHYFISSSHNTYLTGSQINSKSTFEVYRQVLISGCRCIELDLWDGPGGEPEITHGKTLCTRIPVKPVIEAIRDYAFETTAYPLVLSFENHCSPPQMRKIASWLKAILGPYLQSEFLKGDGMDTLPNMLPSPDKLKYKILIKNKKRVEEEPTTEVEDASAASQTDSNPDWAPPVDAAPIEVLVDGELVREDEDEVQRRKERSGEIAKELSDLVTYCTPFRFKGFEVAQKNKCCYHMSSFPERRANRFVAGSAADFVDYNKEQLSRIYPNGSRVSSSNPNPQIYWNVGSQLVALNYQTLGSAPMQLNLGKFEQNGRSGYVLKPPPMTQPEKSFNPFANLPIDEIVALDVSVTVLSAQHLGRKDMMPVVEVHMFGLPSDTSKKFKTRPSRGKGLSPRWNADNTVVFSQVTLPEIALLRFNVYDADKTRDVGWSVIPVSALRPGYRHIQLKYAKSPLAELFVKIGIRIFVPDEHSDFIDRLQNPTLFTSLTARNMAAMEDLLDRGDDEDPGSKPQAGGPQPLAALAKPTRATMQPAMDLGLSWSSPPSKTDTVVRSSGTLPSKAGLQGKSEAVATSIEQFTACVKCKLMSAHHFMSRKKSKGACDHCGKIFSRTKVQECSDCKLTFCVGCVEYAPESCGGHSYLESKRAMAARATHAKELRPIISEFEKSVKQAIQTYEDDLKRGFRASQSDLKKLYKTSRKDHVVSEEDILAFRSRASSDLLERVKDVHVVVHNLGLEFYRRVHPLKLTHERVLADIRTAEQAGDHMVKQQRLDKTLDTESNKSVSNAKRHAKKNDEDWKLLKEEHNKKLVSLSVQVKKRTLAKQSEDKVKLMNQIERERIQLQEAQDKELQACKARHEELQKKVVAMQAKGVTADEGWDKMTFTQYHGSLRAALPLPTIT